MRRWRDVRMTVNFACGECCMMSLVPLRARPFVCRKLSPAPARLGFLALGGLHFGKTIINCFILVHPVRGAKHRNAVLFLCYPTRTGDTSLTAIVCYANWLWICYSSAVHDEWRKIPHTRYARCHVLKFDRNGFVVRWIFIVNGGSSEKDCFFLCSRTGQEPATPDRTIIVLSGFHD